MADRSGYIGRAPGDSSVTIARQSNTASGVTTTFTFNAGYDVGYLDVYINGARLINVTDYAATDGSTITLSAPAQNLDVVEFVAYKAFNVASVSSSTGNFSVGNDLSITGNLSVGGDSTFTGDIDVDGNTELDDVNVSGVVTATSFFGDGSNLTGIVAGATLSAGSGDQRVVLTGQTSGSMTAAATDAELTYNSGTNTLSATTFSGTTFNGSLTGDVTGNVTGTAATFSGNVSVGGVLTYQDVTNVDSIGVVTARSGISVGAGQSVGSNSGTVTYYGDGQYLTGISAGISTTASSPSANTVILLDLSSAQHHELTLTAGITTISCQNGTFGDSHSVVLVQPSSGIATVGFSTYFLFPSGATPSMSEGSGKIDLLSFVVRKVGAAGTELLASAGLNYQ